MVAFIDAHRAEYGVEPICAELQIAPSSYYELKARERDPERMPPRLKRDAAIDEDRRERHDHINRSGRSTYPGGISVLTSGVVLKNACYKLPAVPLSQKLISINCGINRKCAILGLLWLVWEMKSPGERCPTQRRKPKFKGP